MAVAPVAAVVAGPAPASVAAGAGGAPLSSSPPHAAPTSASAASVIITVRFTVGEPNNIDADAPRPPDAPRSGSRAAGGDRGARTVMGARCGQVFDASKMLPIAVSRSASNSASVCCAVKPSVNAREKLAIMPGLRARMALASSRG